MLVSAIKGDSLLESFTLISLLKGYKKVGNLTISVKETRYKRNDRKKFKLIESTKTKIWRNLKNIKTILCLKTIKCKKWNKKYTFRANIFAYLLMAVIIFGGIAEIFLEFYRFLYEVYYNTKFLFCQ